jgi:hypothetical protein
MLVVGVCYGAAASHSKEMLLLIMGATLGGSCFGTFIWSQMDVLKKHYTVSEIRWLERFDFRFGPLHLNALIVSSFFQYQLWAIIFWAVFFNLSWIVTIFPYIGASSKGESASSPSPPADQGAA